MNEKKKTIHVVLKKNPTNFKDMFAMWSPWGPLPDSQQNNYVLLLHLPSF